MSAAPSDHPAHLTVVNTQTTLADARSARIDAQVTSQITANRMERVDGCDWATPAVREVLAEYAADLRESIPLSVMLDRFRRAIEADRIERETEPTAASRPNIRLVS